MTDHGKNLPRIPLQPGDVMEFKDTIGGREVRAGVRFIGLMSKRYILCDVPILSGKPMISTAASKCRVQFLYQGVFYTFNSTVAYIATRPFPMVYIDYPEHVEELDLRAEDRYAVNVPAEVRYKRTGRTADTQGVVIDLSFSGCRISLPVGFEIGDRIDLSFELSPDESVDGLTCEVRNVRTVYGVYECGVEFQFEAPAINGFVSRVSGLMGDGPKPVLPPDTTVRALS